MSILDRIYKHFQERDFEKSRRWNSSYSPEHLKQELKKIGNIQYKYKTIHVAGTVAKGSSVYILSQFLMNKGYKVGSYYSPHVLVFHERMQINNTYISNKELEDCYLELIKQIDLKNLSYFDFITLLAFYWFYKNNVDWAVIETGLGGKLDSTNNLKPSFCVLTPVDYDHQNVLGYSLEEILNEKINILKAEKNYIYPQKPQIKDIIKNKYAEKLKKFIFCDLEKQNHSFQEKNLEVCRWIFEDYFKTSTSQINFSLKGRLEVLSKKPYIIFDMGHNIISVQNLKDWFLKNKGKKSWNFYFNTLKERNLSELLEPFLSIKKDISFYFISCFKNNLFHDKFSIKNLSIKTIHQELELQKLLATEEKNHLIFGSSYLYEPTYHLIKN